MELSITSDANMKIHTFSVMLCLSLLLQSSVAMDDSPPLPEEELTLDKETREPSENEIEMIDEAEKEAKDEIENEPRPHEIEDPVSMRLNSEHMLPLELFEIGKKAEVKDIVTEIVFHMIADFEKVTVSGIGLGEESCYEKPDCSYYINEPYRTMNGKCNNLINGLVGMAGTPSLRLIPPEYGDDKNEFAPRTHGKNGFKLRSARTISHQVFSRGEVLSNDLTLMAMQWGQFLDHDVTKTPTFQALGKDGKLSGIDCCPIRTNRTSIIYGGGAPARNEGGEGPGKRRQHRECFPICVDKDDPMFTEHKRGCMNLVRSLPAPDIECTLTARQQMNSISHFIDGSMVYGSSNKELDSLRDGWRLKTQPNDLLPEAEPSGECPVKNGKPCFLAGDGRVNEQPGLTLMHTLWMREHNRIAQFFKTNTAWDDERIFQTTRRIVIAEIQHITYNEYLKVILGDTYWTERNLSPQTDIGGSYPFYPEYDNKLNPSISNAFSGAAYRFGHSMVRGFFELHKEMSLDEMKKISFFAPQDIYDAGFRASLARGLGRANAQEADKIFSEQVTDHLFQGEGETSGFDLPALNIQRGRDHGLPSYNKYRQYCNLPPVEDFDTFADLFMQPVEVVDALKKLYKDVDNIDLYVGGILEKPYGDSVLGRTFLCIIGDQFFRLKNGDRYFYDNTAQPLPFTNDQLLEIKNKVSLASIMCLNGDNIQKMQTKVFLPPAESSGLVDCGTIPSMDLNVFI